MSKKSEWKKREENGKKIKIYEKEIIFRGKKIHIQVVEIPNYTSDKRIKFIPISEN